MSKDDLIPVRKHPLEHLQDQEKQYKREIKAILDDMALVPLSGRAEQERYNRIDAIKAKLADNEEEVYKVAKFIKRMKDIQKGIINPVKSDLPRFEYFYNNLKPYHFTPCAPSEPCDICGKVQSRRTGVVYTFNPVTYELQNICTNDYIELKEKAKELKNQVTEEETENEN